MYELHVIQHDVIQHVIQPVIRRQWFEFKFEMFDMKEVHGDSLNFWV
jgi:hypothetical protein